MNMKSRRVPDMGRLKCVLVCFCLCVCVCTCVRETHEVCVYLYTHIMFSTPTSCFCTCMSSLTHVSMYVHMYVCTCTHIRIYTHPRIAHAGAEPRRSAGWERLNVGSHNDWWMGLQQSMGGVDANVPEWLSGLSLKNSNKPNSVMVILLMFMYVCMKT
jgi:hypothetical protein